MKHFNKVIKVKVALRALYATVFFMNDILVDQIKRLPLSQDTEKNNRPKPEDLLAHQSQFPMISGATLHQSRNTRVLL